MKHMTEAHRLDDLAKAALANVLKEQQPFATYLEALAAAIEDGAVAIVSDSDGVLVVQNDEGVEGSYPYEGEPEVPADVRARLQEHGAGVDTPDDVNARAAEHKPTEEGEALLKALAATITAELEPLNEEIDMSKTQVPNLNTLAREIAKRDGCSAMEAMRRARKENSAAYAMHKHAPKFPVVPTKDQVAAYTKQLEANASFEKAVEDIREQDKCSGRLAMQKARKVHPNLYCAYQRT